MTTINESERVVLGKEQIMAVDDIKYEFVHVPEWAPEGVNPDNTFVMIKTLTARERDAFEASMVSGVGKSQRIDTNNVRAKLASLVIRDPVTKARMFGKDEIKALAEKSSAALDRVYERAMELSKFNKEDLEGTVGNSASAQSDV